MQTGAREPLSSSLPCSGTKQAFCSTTFRTGSSWNFYSSCGNGRNPGWCWLIHIGGHTRFKGHSWCYGDVFSSEKRTCSTMRPKIAVAGGHSRKINFVENAMTQRQTRLGYLNSAPSSYAVWHSGGSITAARKWVASVTRIAFTAQADSTCSFQFHRFQISTSGLPKLEDFSLAICLSENTTARVCLKRYAGTRIQN